MAKTGDIILLSFFYIVDERLEKILYACDLQGINKKALIRSLIEKGIVLPEQNRGQKFRLAINNIGSFRCYRLDREKAEGFIKYIETRGNIGE